LAVLPNCQGEGVGGQILDWLELHAFGSSRNLWALTSSFNAGARRFYAKRGFVEVCALRGLLRPEYDELLLRKTRPDQDQKPGG
jgi:GNAT superfamily N-acetyltransferase